MKPLDLEVPAEALNVFFGNVKGEVKVAFLLVAAAVSPDAVGETSVISNITDQQVLLRIVSELRNAMTLKAAQPEGRA